MFEKEAEEIANKKLCSERICYNHCNYNSPKHHRCGEWHRIYDCAKESAEFGYNKANEWHKVAEGDYPPFEKDGFTINVFTDRGEIAYYNHDFDYWIAEPASVEIDPPIAWCEIPKYKE